MLITYWSEKKNKPEIENSNNGSYFLYTCYGGRYLLSHTYIKSHLILTKNNLRSVKLSPFNK